MGLRIYIVCSNDEATCLVVATDKETAEEIAQSQSDIDICDCANGWEAYEIYDYFPTIGVDKSEFFSWMFCPGQTYMSFT